MRFLLIALLLLASAWQAEASSLTAVPSAAEENQVVTIVAVGAVPTDSIWSLSGGEWCLSVRCYWRSDADLNAGATQHPLWRAGTTGSYTITLTTPEGSAVTVTVVVAEP